MKSLAEVSQERSKKINKIEELKKRRTPAEAFAQLETYAKNGYGSMLPDDLDFLLKSFGIYDRPQPNSFMIRVRVPNGKLTYQMALKVGEIANLYGAGQIDVTTRMQFQIRNLRIETVPTVLKELESVGLSPFQTGVDNIRNIVSDPLNSFAVDSVIETDSIVERMNNIFVKKDEWITVLPRKFNVGINGSFSNRSNIWGHDVAFVLAQKDGNFGFNLYLGGKVGESAKATNIFLTNSDEVVYIFELILNIFKEFGFRDNRNKNRLFYLIDSIGITKFEEEIRSQSKINFLTSGKSMIDFENLNNDLVQLKNKKYAKLIVVPAGIFSGNGLIELAEITKNIDGELRFSYDQNIYIVGVDKLFLENNKNLFVNFDKFSNPYYKNMIACAGSKDCPFGVIPNKPDAINMANYLSEKVPLSDDSTIRFHWSGCPKGCGIHGFGDIGFEGTRVKSGGSTVDGVYLSIGGKMNGEGREGHRFMKAMPITEAKLYISDLMRIYKSKKLNYETFSKFEERFLSKYSNGALEFILKFSRKFNEIPEKFLHEKPQSGKIEQFEIFAIGVEIYKNLSGVLPYLDIKNFTSKSNFSAKEIKHVFYPVLAKMIERDINHRYEAFSEIIVDMEKLS